MNQYKKKILEPTPTTMLYTHGMVNFEGTPQMHVGQIEEVLATGCPCRVDNPASGQTWFFYTVRQWDEWKHNFWNPQI